MSENLHHAHNQWATRPADERFQSLASLHAACAMQRNVCKTAKADWSDFEVGVDTAGRPVLAGKSGGYALLNNWSLSQVANKIGAPARYLAKLPGDLAAECLSHGLTTNKPEGEARLLLNSAGPVPTVRAITSAGYTRIWNAEITDRVANMGGNWTLPMGYKDGKWGAELVPSGAYVGDRDFFLFMVDTTKRIEDGSEGGCSRGFFLWNSEVGAKSFGIATFLYRHVCGNNIVWGASRFVEQRIRHVGEADVKAFAELSLALTDYAESSAVEDEAAIARARELLLGKDEEEVVAQVVKVTNCPQKVAKEAFTIGSQWAEVDGHPTTLWGMVNGITRYAQLSQWTEDRVEVDGIAQRLFVKVMA